MKLAIANVKGIGLYSQGKPHFTEKKSKELHEDYEKRTWREKAHYDSKGNCYIPAIQFENAIKEVAKHLSETVPGKGKATYTKHFARGVQCVSDVSLGVNIKEIEQEMEFGASDGQRGGSRRVMKYFPIFSGWGGELTFLILDDIISKSVFEKYLEQSGLLIGVGKKRPTYGKFVIDGEVEWEEDEEKVKKYLIDLENKKGA